MQDVEYRRVRKNVINNIVENLLCRFCGCHKEWHSIGKGHKGYGGCHFLDSRQSLMWTHADGTRVPCNEYGPKDNLEYLEWKYEKRGIAK